jgi:hypothetical protein
MRSQDDILAIKELEGTVEYLMRHYEDVVKERDKALAEYEAATKHYNEIINKLRSELHDLRLENSGQAAQLERKRPEPSRLEIAAMLLQGLLPMHVKSTDVDVVALKLADRLIAAAKEGK